jgi:hypothetical protein
MSDLEKFTFADLVGMKAEIKDRNWKDDDKSKYVVGLLLLDIDDEIGKRLNRLLVNRNGEFK